jgi:hypothetical protein
MVWEKSPTFVFRQLMKQWNQSGPLNRIVGASAQFAAAQFKLNCIR